MRWEKEEQFPNKSGDYPRSSLTLHEPVLSSLALTPRLHHCESEGRRAPLLSGTVLRLDKARFPTSCQGREDLGWSYPTFTELFPPALSLALLQQLYYNSTHLELLVPFRTSFLGSHLSGLCT